MSPAAVKASPSRYRSEFRPNSGRLPTERKNSYNADDFEKYEAFRKLNDFRDKLEDLDLPDLDKYWMNISLVEISEYFIRLILNLENLRLETMQALTLGSSILKERMQERISVLEDENRRDRMTQLLDHEEFHAQAAGYLVKADHGIYALGFIDIREFKKLNDSKGHAIGDVVIKRVARIIGQHIRGKCRLGNCIKADAAPSHTDCLECTGIDLRGRVGGDEFAFLMTNFSDFSEVFDVSDRFRRACSDDPILRELGIQVDIGVIAMKFEKQTTMDQDELFIKAYRQAEELMYEFKSRSKLGENPNVPVMGWKINGRIEPLLDPR